MELKKLFNIEDWWATFSGLAIFLLICVAACFPIPKDLNAVPAWTYFPMETSDHFYYWLTAIPALATFLFFTTTSNHFLNFNRKDDDKKYIYSIGLVLIFVVATVSIVIGNQKDMKALGIGSSLWSICLGIFLSNCVFRLHHVFTRREYITLEGPEEPTFTSKWSEPCLPYWLRDCTQDEFFIKISLVLLAMDLMSAKDSILPSMLVSWIDTPLLVLFIYIIGTKIFRIESDYSLITAASVSVCGSSAANAVGTTIGASKNAVGYPIAIMSLFTVPMIPMMPLFYAGVLKNFGWDDTQGGAWIGGSVDSTGAVIASASIISSDAKDAAAIVKMLQNCLIGPICLVVILCQRFQVSRDPKSASSDQASQQNIGKMLWDRFPKFVLGFFLVCGLLTLAPSGDWKERAIPTCLALSSWFETIGFVCIGLNIHVGEMLSKLGVLKLIPLYIVGQLLDCTTTAIATYYAL